MVIKQQCLPVTIYKRCTTYNWEPKFTLLGELGGGGGCEDRSLTNGCESWWNRKKQVYRDVISFVLCEKLDLDLPSKQYLLRTYKGIEEVNSTYFV